MEDRQAQARSVPFPRGERVRWLGDDARDGLTTGTIGIVSDVIEGAFAEVIVIWPDPTGMLAHGEAGFR